MLNFIRKVFHLAPYNRPNPTIRDLQGTFKTVSIATPTLSVRPIDGRFAIVDADDNVLKSYTTKSNAMRGMKRLVNG